MTLRQAFTSMLHLFVVFAFFGLGAFVLALPYLPRVRFELIDILTHRLEECVWVGAGICLVAALLFLSFYALNRGRYLVIKMGIKADFALIRHTIEDCFTRQFSKKITLQEVEVGPKQLLQIRVTLAPLEEKSREELFVQAEKHLRALLRDRFGYIKPFILVTKI